MSNEQSVKDGVIHIMPPNLNEYLPEGEDVDNWTQMISREVFKNLRGIDPEWYLMKMKKEDTDTLCPGQITYLVSSGERNGYSEAVALAHCPQGEITMYKAVQGRDSFYVVWRSLRVLPFDRRNVPMSQKRLYEWTVYFRDNVLLCDLRIPGSCPAYVEDNPDKF